MKIFLVLIISVFGETEAYDVAQWWAETPEQVFEYLAECQQAQQQAPTVLQCEAYSKQEYDNLLNALRVD